MKEMHWKTRVCEANAICILNGFREGHLIEFLFENTRFTLFILKIDLENCVVRGNKYENDTISDATSITKYKKKHNFFFVFPSCKFSVERGKVLS